jgi:hypothetical protein
LLQHYFDATARRRRPTNRPTWASRIGGGALARASTAPAVQRQTRSGAINRGCLQALGQDQLVTQPLITRLVASDVTATAEMV